MRTKTLILSALCGLMGSAAAMAQVYSVNAVGYVNKTFTAGQFSLFANPLDSTNTLASIFSSFTANDTGTSFYKWNVATGQYDMASFDSASGGWFSSTGDDANGWKLNPGEGAWLQPTRTVTVTFVGTVRTGNLTATMPRGQYVLLSSQVPQAADVDVLNLTPGCGEGDAIYKWNGTDYQTYMFGGGVWVDLSTGNPVSPTIDVGESVFFYTDTQHANDSTFNRTFEINK